MNQLNHLNNIIQIISEAKFELNNQPEEFTGLSGNKLLSTLQSLSKYQYDEKNGCYLEIGVYQGLTLLSVALANPTDKVYGIDNFSQFDPDNININIIKSRIQQHKLNNAILLNMDYEDALSNLLVHIDRQKIGTFFIDGPHDYRSQIICLLFAKKYLAEGAIIIIDDCNYRHVRQANRDFLFSNPEFKLLFESYTPCHPANMTDAQLNEAKKGWWNGVNIIVHDPSDSLKAIYPETIRSRSLYENDHIIHTIKNSELAPEATSLVSAFIDLNIFRILKDIIKIFLKTIHLNKIHKGQFTNTNTHSESLKDENYTAFKP